MLSKSCNFFLSLTIIARFWFEQCKAEHHHFGCVRFSSFVVATEARAVKAPPSSGKRPGAAAHLHLKGHTQKHSVFAHTQIGAILTSYNK